MYLPTAKDAERAFYAALAAGDLEQLMAVWADDHASVCTHPGGARQTGHAAIRSAFRDVFAAGGLRVQTVSLHAWSQGDVAVHSLIEQIAASPLTGGETLEQLTTNVFVRTARGWRMLVHHATLNETLATADDDVEDGDLPEWMMGRAERERLLGDDDGETEFAESRRSPGDRLH